MTEHTRGERTLEARHLTVSDVLASVVADYEANGRRSVATLRGHVAALEAAINPKTLAEAISTELVQRAQKRWQDAGTSNGTINRRGNVLRRGLRLAWRVGKLARVAYIPRLKEPKRRARRISVEEAEAIRQGLPLYVRDAFSLALLLGIRRGQLSRTARRFVDLERGVVEWPAAECKADEPHTVPLDADALAIVRRAMRQARPHCPYLFHGRHCAPGRRPSGAYGCLGNFTKVFRRAVLAAGLPCGRKEGGIVFHCTRSTAATMLRAGGLGEDDCMRIGGWKTRSVFNWYQLGDVEALRDRLSAARKPRGAVVALGER
jgi:integrase